MILLLSIVCPVRSCDPVFNLFLDINTLFPNSLFVKYIVSETQSREESAFIALKLFVRSVGIDLGLKYVSLVCNE